MSSIKSSRFKSRAILQAVFFIFLLSGLFYSKSAFAAGPTYVSGTISTVSTWTLNNSPYVVQSDITIYATLMIEPGVVVKLNPQTKITINGKLNANGTPSQPIYFTSIKDDSVGGDTNNDGSATTPAQSDWDNIEVYGGSLNISHSSISYGGSQYGGGNGSVFAHDNAHLSISDSRFFQNYRSIVVSNSTADITTTDIGYSNIGILQVGGSSTIISSEIHHSDTGIAQYSGTIITSQLSIHDNTQQGIFITSGAIIISQSSVYNNSTYGIRGLAGTLSITNTDFQGNHYPLYLSPAVNFTHSNLTASNNDINGIGMNGTTAGDRIWTKDSIPYIVFSNATSSTVIISQGDTLTIDPGVIVKFAFFFSEIIAYGTLNANGTPSQPIYFTSIKDDSVGGDTNNDGTSTTPNPGDWLSIEADGGTINISHSIISYGGFYFADAGSVSAYNNANFSISDSRFFKNYRSIVVSNSVANITRTNIGYSYIGIQQTNGAVTISQSNIHDNVLYGAYSTGTNIMNAQNNYWGTPAGPYHPTLNQTGTGNKVSDNVDFIPWLTEDSFAPPTPQPPTISEMRQYKSDGIMEIQEGDTINNDIVVFKGKVESPLNNQAKLQVELKEKDQAFNEQDLIESGFVNSGSTASITRYGLIDGQYKWRARAVDSQENISAWQEYGIQGNVDFEVLKATTIKVAVILAEPYDVPHISTSITEQPCKLIPQKTYTKGHGKEYFEDLAYCVKDYYSENSYGKINLEFTIFDNDGGVV